MNKLLAIFGTSYILVRYMNEIIILKNVLHQSLIYQGLYKKDN
jgi:hypothetical protein